MTAKLSAMGGCRGQALLRLVAAGSLAVMLAGCFQTQQVAENHYPTDYRERHPITLHEGVRTVRVFLNRSRGGLSAEQRADVLAFAQLWRNEADGGIIIDVPWGGPTDRAASASMREIRSLFDAAGVPRRAIYVRRFRPSRFDVVSIRINYTKLVAKAGPCGLWPHDLGPAAGAFYRANDPYWNLGCATQRNLAAEVANPSDLVEPRVEQPAYEPRRTVVLDKYRKGENMSGTYVGYDKGRISELGK